jgi:hypothetical protein
VRVIVARTGARAAEAELIRSLQAAVDAALA